eukprot:RCo040200
MSALTFWKDQASGLLSKLKDRIEKETEEFKREEAKYSHEAVLDTTHEVPVWEKVPPLWANGRAGEWALLVQQLIEDDNTFLCGFSESSSSSACSPKINFTFIENAADLAPCGMVSIERYPRLAEVRFRLVPRRVKETAFWQHFFWKCRELGNCSSATQVKEMLLVINCPRGGSPEQRVSQELHLDELLVPLFGLEKNRLWLQERLQHYEATADAAKESARLLLDLLGSSPDISSISPAAVAPPEPRSSAVVPASADLDSLYQSCRFHKLMLSETLGEINEHGCALADELQCRFLGDVSEHLSRALREYAEAKSLSGSSAFSEGQPHRAGAVTETLAAPPAPPVLEPAVAGPPQPHADLSDEELETKMPWEAE